MSTEEEEINLHSVASQRVVNKAIRLQSIQDSIELLTSILSATKEVVPYPTSEPMKESIWNETEELIIKKKIFELMNKL